MTQTLLDYYANLNATRSAKHVNTDRRTFGVVTPVVSLYKPRHRRVECHTVQTHQDGTLFHYWCLTHNDGADTPVVCMSGDL